MPTSLVRVGDGSRGRRPSAVATWSVTWSAVATWSVTTWSTVRTWSVTWSAVASAASTILGCHER
eukprot:5288008-Prymnesium_polylepis.1